MLSLVFMWLNLGCAALNFYFLFKGHALNGALAVLNFGCFLALLAERSVS